MLDIICQVVITIGGLAAIYLVEKENRWGFVIGLCNQPFWLYTTAANNQWGLFFLSFVYAFIWARGIRRRFFAPAPATAPVTVPTP